MIIIILTTNLNNYTIQQEEVETWRGKKKKKTKISEWAVQSKTL